MPALGLAAAGHFCPGAAVPGSADLDPDVLIDDLVTLVDDLREDLIVGFGLRQFRLFTVRRTWDGEGVGDGAFEDELSEITPRPLVNAYQDNVMYRLEPCGIDESGMVLISEVSLSYTEAELTGGALLPNQEWFLLLVDGHGQQVPLRDFVMMSPPFPDRETDLGWKIRLKRRESGDGC